MGRANELRKTQNQDADSLLIGGRQHGCFAIFGIWLGFREGRQQAIVLSNIADSTQHTVDAMKELRKE